MKGAVLSKLLFPILMQIGRGSIIVLIGDMNGRVGNREIACVVVKWGMDEYNENSEYQVCVKGGCS